MKLLLRVSMPLACSVSAVLAAVPNFVAAQAAHSAAMQAQTKQAARAESETIPAIFLSDIHFDPFHDPGKVKKLASAPLSEWKSILASVPSADQQQAFEAMQHSCHSRGVDTPFALLESSLKAMRAQQPDAKFMMVSGDLMAHAFTCRYGIVFPGAPQADYEAFVVKTLSFVSEQLHASFPGMPIYISLGNNDSGCGDYQLDAGDDWLSQTGKVVAADLPASQQGQAAKQFATGGYYSVSMAAPMKNTRLLVVNDVFFSPKFKTCSGKPDPAAADEQLSWLAQQLQQARQAGQRVWVMGHIPPGLDLHATVLKFADVCSGDKPVPFLSSDKMADLLVENADTVKLALFGHTHMDELHLLKAEGAAAGDGSGQGATPGQAANSEKDPAGAQAVVLKQTASISPVDGNNPSFTIARIDPAAAKIDDYTVFAASNQTGIGTTWSKEYDYRSTYHEPDFSVASMTNLAKKFQGDHAATLPISQSYLRGYFVGDRAAELSLFWPQYACTFDHYSAKGYASCACAAGN